MVYVNNDGKIRDSRPWNLQKLYDMFWGTLDTLSLFFQTMIFPGSRSAPINNTSNRSSGTGSRYSGARGGQSGGFRTMSDIRPPPPAFGGCSGGSCGM